MAYKQDNPMIFFINYRNCHDHNITLETIRNNNQINVTLIYKQIYQKKILKKNL